MILLSEKTLVVIEIHPSQSESELFDVVRLCSDQMDAMDAAGKNYLPPVMVVGGFNDDPRELWQIPEAIDLLNRACRAGFLSILEPSVMLKSEVPRKFTTAFGAMELWLVARKIVTFKYEKVEIHPEHIKRFCRLILSDNQRLRKRIELWRACNASKGGQS